MTAASVELGLSEVVWADAVSVPPCEAAGHGEDAKRHDGGPAYWYVRSLHPCWGPVDDLVAVCRKAGEWITANREALGRCPVCGETKYLQDWTYVVRRIG